jgi:F-type H+-transporting ATPase subunit a
MRLRLSLTMTLLALLSTALWMGAAMGSEPSGSAPPSAALEHRSEGDGLNVALADPPEHGEEPEGANEHGGPEHAAGDQGDHGDEDAHGEHGDAAHHGEHLELPHLIMVLRNFAFGDNESLVHYSHVFENAFFAILAGIVLSLVAARVYRRRSELPGRVQAFFEILVEQVLEIAGSMMGPKNARHYAPFVATIFCYLLVMNYSALIPLGKAPTATFLNNISVAICVFLYVQYTGIRRNGLGGYLFHLAGSPKDIVGWCLSPLMFFLEVFGEFIKPVSLSLRLFGNIFGEDTLLAVFALLGVVALSATGSPIGIPLHLPFLFLSLLLGLIQALVFSLLTTVYISLMLPHEHDEEHAVAH